ncbi:tetratricopeptide repeat protein [Fibrobacter sp. UBA4309]|uniref:tetratricopeptide repeat protein n=1 Tax=Fibrobacter sp. UBA4309 TaxID=1946537 RepID=UPI0025BC97D1|nr:tetratricopeptide repeat protein [Fibrobacter sp. UBA4309]
MVSLPFAADPRMEQGARFEAKGEYEMALGEYRSVLAEDPKNSEAYFAAAEVRMKMKDLAGALANYRLAYKFQPTMSAAYEGAAKVYEAMGQKAKADAERAKDPKNKPAEESVAEAAPAPVEEPKAAPEPVAKAAEPAKPVELPKAQEPAKAEEPVKAVEAPKKEEPAKVAEAPSAASSDPFERGKALLAEGKYKEAAPVWREILAKKPGDAGAYFYAGVTRFEMGEYDKAEFNLKKGISFKERGNDANYYLAQIYQKTGKAELEKKSLAAYLKKAAPDGMFRKAAEARFAELTAAPAETPKEESVAAAEPAAETVAEPAAPVETKPAPATAPAKKNSAIADANMLFKAGSFEQALQMYKALLETDVSADERYFAMLQMGNIYRELRDFHSAVVRYREVVQQYPDSDWATEAERALEDAVWLEKHASELPRRTR